MRYSLKILLLVFALVAAAMAGWQAYERRDRTTELIEYFSSTPGLAYRYDTYEFGRLHVTVDRPGKFNAHLITLLNRSSVKHADVCLSSIAGVAEENRLSFHNTIHLIEAKGIELKPLLNRYTVGLELWDCDVRVQEAKSAYPNLRNIQIHQTNILQGHLVDLLQHNTSFDELKFDIPLDDRFIDFLCTRKLIGHLQLRIEDVEDLKVLHRLLDAPCRIQLFNIIGFRTNHPDFVKIQLLQGQLHKKGRSSAETR